MSNKTKNILNIASMSLAIIAAIISVFVAMRIGIISDEIKSDQYSQFTPLEVDVSYTHRGISYGNIIRIPKDKTTFEEINLNMKNMNDKEFLTWCSSLFEEN